MSDATTGGIAPSPGTLSTNSAFYALAEVSHWAQSDQGSIPVPLSVKKRLEGRVWFNYPGQSNVDYVVTNAAGASTSPSVTARLLDGIFFLPPFCRRISVRESCDVFWGLILRLCSG